MRTARAVALVALAAACAPADDSDLDRANGAPTGETSAERLDVPEQYRMVWNTTEPCVDADDSLGVQVYRHSADAQSTLQGAAAKLDATETWYWFHGDNSPSDCKDTFRISAVAGPTPPEIGACEGCEEVWVFTRQIIASTCPYAYAPIFGQAELQADPDTFEGVLLFDTHTATGETHDEGRMGITAVFRTDERDVLDPDYAIRGMTRRVAVDPARLGPPASYSWVGASCIAEAP